MKPVFIGTRGSHLALAQAGLVRSLLLTENPARPVELVIVKTTGDRRLDLSLASTGPLDKGLFTKELESELATGAIDLAVHSLKDLPVDSPPGFEIGAILSREHTGDMLLRPAGGNLPANARIGTSSPRRALQLAAAHPEWSFPEIRGNVPTRIRKLKESGDFDGIVLATAGLKRLGFLDRDLLPIPGADCDGIEIEMLDELLPAPGQGAIALQIRNGDEEIKNAIAPLHCAITGACVSAERELLHALGGGCHRALGALASPAAQPGILNLRAVYFPDSDNPGCARRAEVSGPSADPAGLARLAATVLNP